MIASGGEDAEFQFVNGAISVVIDTRLYRAVAIKKTAYRLADRCTAVIGPLTEPLVSVSLHFKAGTYEIAALETARAFYQELLDQELREQIAEETNAVRTLILAHAFSKADLIKRD